MGEKVLYDVTITPTIYNIKQPTIYSGCMYDSNGIVVVESLRGPNSCIKFIGENMDKKTLESMKCYIYDSPDVSYIFMGLITSHWGHFIIETLQRFNYIINNGTANKKFVFNRWFWNHNYGVTLDLICNVFNINTDDVIIITTPTKFSKVLIPEPNVYVWHDAEMIQQRVYDYITAYCIRYCTLEPSFPRLFLMRGDIVNQKNAIKIFAKYNFVPIFLEFKKWRENIYLLNNADIIAGYEGTNMHNGIFMKNGKTVIILGSKRRPNCKNVNQDMLDKINNINVINIEYGSDIEDKLKQLDILKADVSNNSVNNTIDKIEYGGVCVTDKISQCRIGNYFLINTKYNDIFGDPMPGVVKYLEIYFSDGRKQVFSENTPVSIKVAQ